MGHAGGVLPRSRSTPSAEAMLSEAVKLHQSGAMAPARALYRQVLEAAPGHSDALHLLGVLSAQVSDFKQSVDLIGKAIKIRPDPRYYSNRGIAYKALNNLSRAVASYDRAIELDSGFVEAYSNRGNALQRAYEMQSGDSHSKRAGSIRTKLALAYSNRGGVLSGQSLLNEALASYDKAIALRPDFSSAWSNRGAVLLDLGRVVDAIDSCDTAIAHDKSNAEAWSNRGLALQSLRLFEQALKSFDEAVGLSPRYVEAWSNRGIALHHLNRMNEALACFDNAIALDADHAEAFCNKGISLAAMNQPQQAIECYDQAIRLNPKSASAHFNKALALLVMGDFEKGWKLYEWRWRLKNAHPPEFDQPMWLGAESLRDCTVLLHGEQGLGDVIQMSRFAKLVAASGARVTMQVPATLTGLIARVDGVTEALASPSVPENFDFHVPIMSLPFVFKTRLNTVPAEQAYIKADPKRVTQWAKRLGEKRLPRVGVVWSGDPAHPNDHNRSIPFKEFIRFMPADFSYVCLQRELRKTDPRALVDTQGVQFFGDSIETFSDTAALCDLMDLVITVDTSVGHLAGAMGRPTWLLLPYAPDFRWLLDRSDTPWYPTVKLFRQQSAGGWSEVLGAIKSSLACMSFNFYCQ
jgi:tetratricopeptide (TPR) repeat protein